jgi:putative intracellular protease/amidase
MRRVVIIGPPPVQLLDVAGPLEVFSNAPGYHVEIATPDDERELRTNRGISLTGALPLGETTGPIDTLVISGGPGSESGV